MNIAIIHHDADWDGKLSNEVCRYWLKKLHPDAAIHSYGWDYGRPCPVASQLARDEGTIKGVCGNWPDYDQIYIVDLSVDELMAREELRSKIIWIDHHKSAIEKWDGPLPSANELRIAPIFTGCRIDGVAACRLCWQWFTDRGCSKYQILSTKQDFIDRKVREPRLIRLAGEYDIWDHRDPDAKTLQFGLRACSDRELCDVIQQQFEDTPEGYGILCNVIEGGRMIKSYCDKNDAEYAAAFAHTIHWKGLTFCALNIGKRGNSDLLNGAIRPEHDALFAWRYDGKTGNCIVSLYHAPGKEHHDLSLIATQMGGGGHRGACGFQCSLEQLSKLLTTA